jgi:O6-methylguanine-DNA--protein-cysteine methyltransferase
MFRDGPLTRRAPETIGYGTGRCALGALLVASSELQRRVWSEVRKIPFGAPQVTSALNSRTV